MRILSPPPICWPACFPRRRAAAADCVAGCSTCPAPQRDTGNEFLTGARVYFGLHQYPWRHSGPQDQPRGSPTTGLPANTLALTRQWLRRLPVALFGYTGADNVDAVMSDRQLRTNGSAMVGLYSGTAPLPSGPTLFGGARRL